MNKVSSQSILLCHAHLPHPGMVVHGWLSVDKVLTQKELEEGYECDLGRNRQGENRQLLTEL